jgi:hypothetical protein
MWYSFSATVEPDTRSNACRGEHNACDTASAHVIQLLSNGGQTHCSRRSVGECSMGHSCRACGTASAQRWSQTHGQTPAAAGTESAVLRAHAEQKVELVHEVQLQGNSGARHTVKRLQQKVQTRQCCTAMLSRMLCMWYSFSATVEPERRSNACIRNTMNAIQIQRMWYSNGGAKRPAAPAA